MIAPTKSNLGVPAGTRSVGQILRSQGKFVCAFPNCGRTISGNKKFCKEHTPEGDDNHAVLIDRMKRIT